MRRLWLRGAIAVGVSSVLGLGAAWVLRGGGEAVKPVARVSAPAAFGAAAPIRFEENLGQAPLGARFVARGPGYALALTDEGPRLSQAGAAPVGVRWLGGSATAPRGEQPQAERRNYLVGEQSRWHTGVSTFAAVRYPGVYPGVDVVFYGSARQLEYDLVVAPGADPSKIRLKYEGADAVRLTGAGDLELSVGRATLVQHAPRVYQVEAGERRAVSGAYRVSAGGEVTLALGAYDAHRELVIDPVLRYSTFLGGTGQDNARAVAVDAAGDVYVTGYTNSAAFLVTGGAYDPVCNVSTTCTNAKDAFVTKLSAATGQAIWSTFLGGDSADQGNGIAVDSGGRVFVVGETSSLDFPTTGANPINGYALNSGSSFLSILDANGTALDASVPLSDTGILTLRGVGFDGAGNVWVGGLINPSTATKNACPSVDVDPGNSTSFAALALRFSLGGALTGCTMVTTSAGETNPFGFAVNSTGVYFTGRHDGKASGWDAFVARLDTSGSLLYYSTFGGNSDDYGNGIAADSAGNAYLVGYTGSSDLPTTAGSPQQTMPGFQDAFAAKLDTTGHLVYATYIGGASSEEALAVAVDAQGNAWVGGNSDSAGSSTFPITANASQASGGRAFLTRIDPNGTSFTYSSLLGGSGNVGGGEKVAAIALGLAGEVWTAGWTDSTDFPVTTAAPHTPAPQQMFATGVMDGFVARVVPAVNLSVAFSANPGSPEVGVPATVTVTVTNAQITHNVPASTQPAPDVATGVTLTINPPGGVTLGAVTGNGGTCTGAGPFTCTFPSIAPLGAASASFTVTSGAAGQLTMSASATSEQFDPDSSNDSATFNLGVGTGGAGGGAGGGSGGGTGGGGDGGGGCFIATAAYGTPMAEDVRYLRAFRDRFLLTNGPGRLFVKTYYALSPRVADAIRGSELLKEQVREDLVPLVVMSRLLLDAQDAARETADRP